MVGKMIGSNMNELIGFFSVFFFSKLDTSALNNKPIDSCYLSAFCGITLFEPRCEKTGFLHMRKQRRRSAAQ